MNVIRRKINCLVALELINETEKFLLGPPGKQQTV